MIRDVEFRSQGVTLRGRLYGSAGRFRPSPVLIMAHGFSATATGMVADRYAEVFAEAGVDTLLFDHRGFGRSDGEPRQQINRWIQARGYRDAVDFAVSLPEIDAQRVAIWGDSMSGGEVLVAGAMDPRVRAVVAQVPACGDHPPPPDPDGGRFASVQESFLHGDLTGVSQAVVGPMPVVSFDQVGTPSLLTPLTAFRWFIEYGGRHGTGWENLATVVTPSTPVAFHPVLCAPHLHGSLLMVIARDDEMPGANPSIARMAFDLAPQPKEVVEIDGGHFGLLHFPSSLFDQASSAQRDFLVRRLLEETTS